MRAILVLALLATACGRDLAYCPSCDPPGFTPPSHNTVPPRRAGFLPPTDVNLDLSTPESPPDMAAPEQPDLSQPEPTPDLGTPEQPDLSQPQVPDLSSPPDLSEPDDPECSCELEGHGRGTGHCKEQHELNSRGHGNGHCKYDCQ